MEGLADSWQRHSVGNRARLKRPLRVRPPSLPPNAVQFLVSAKVFKTCSRCGLSKPISDFYPTYQYGKHYRRTRCKQCDNILRTQRPKSIPTATQKEEWARRDAARQRRDRRDPRHDAKFIHKDSLKSDRKLQRENDLTREFIAAEIAKGCCYCGETELRMTLDRVDNDRGHTRDNVVPACIRCNYVRRNMPYEAWLVISTAMQEARQRGLFGDWTGRARSLGGASRLATAPALNPGER